MLNRKHIKKRKKAGEIMNKLIYLDDSRVDVGAEWSKLFRAYKELNMVPQFIEGRVDHARYLAELFNEKLASGNYDPTLANRANEMSGYFDDYEMSPENVVVNKMLDNFIKSEKEELEKINETNNNLQKLVLKAQNGELSAKKSKKVFNHFNKVIEMRR